MTDTDYEALGRRAVACKGWRWMPGMLTMSLGRFGRQRLVIPDQDPLREGDTPDFRDPATLGCLLALVREAYEIPSLQCGHVGGWDEDWDTWEVSNPAGRGVGCAYRGRGATEAEALIAALESAP